MSQRVQCLGCGNSNTTTKAGGALRWAASYLPENLQSVCQFCSKDDEGYYNYSWAVLQQDARPPINFKNKRYELGIHCSCKRPLDDNPKSREVCRKCGSIIHDTCVAPDKTNVAGFGNEIQIVCMDCYKTDLAITITCPETSKYVAMAISNSPTMQNVPVTIKSGRSISVDITEKSIPISVDFKSEDGYNKILDRISLRTSTQRRGDTSRKHVTTCILCTINEPIISDLCKACAVCFDRTCPFVIPISISYGRESLLSAKLLKAYIEIVANFQKLPHAVTLSNQDAYLCVNEKCRAIMRAKDLKGIADVHSCTVCGSKGSSNEYVRGTTTVLETVGTAVKMTGSSDEILSNAKDFLNNVTFPLKTYHLPDLTIAGRKIILPENITDLSMITHIIAEIAEEHQARCYAAKNGHLPSCNTNCGDNCISTFVVAGKQTNVSNSNSVSYTVMGKSYEISSLPDKGFCEVSVSGTTATDEFDFTSATVVGDNAFLRLENSIQKKNITLPQSKTDLDKLKKLLESMPIVFGSENIS